MPASAWGNSRFCHHLGVLVTLLGLLGVLVVLFVGGVLATRDTGLLRDVPPDRSPVAGVGDLEGVRFSLAVRGYRMSQVDEVLDRAGAALAAAQQQLAQSRQELDRTRRELVQTRQELAQTRQELAQTRQELDRARQQVEDPRERSALSAAAHEDWREPGDTGTIEP